jgi:hypothetical protein
MREGDATLMRRGLAMISSLWISDCNDSEQLLQLPPISTDPAHRARVIELETALIRAGSLAVLGDLATRERELDDLVIEATELDETAIVANALIVRGTLTTSSRGPDVGFPFLRRSVVIAELAGIDELRARAWLGLAQNRLAADRDGELVDIAFDEVEMLVPRLPERSEVGPVFEHVKATRAMQRGDVDSALEHLDASIELARAKGLVGRGLPAMQTKVFALLNAGRMADVGAAADELIALRLELYGPGHPDTALSLASVAIVRAELGDVDAGIASFEAAQRTLDEWGGRGNIYSIATACNFCRVLTHACRVDRVVDVCHDCVERSVVGDEAGGAGIWVGRLHGLLGVIAVAPESGVDVATQIVELTVDVRDELADEVAGLAALVLADGREEDRGLKAAHDLLGRNPGSAGAALASIVIAEYDPSAEQRAAARERIAGELDDARLDELPYLFARASLVLVDAGRGIAAPDAAAVDAAVEESCSARLRARWARDR